MPIKRCKKPGCRRPAEPGRLYCSIGHSPYGHLATTDNPDKRRPDRALYPWPKGRAPKCGCPSQDAQDCRSVTEGNRALIDPEYRGCRCACHKGNHGK